jgi:ATP-dependent Clp protease ATP-binding subunit ClpA
MLTQSRLVSATSARSNLALVLFDEVEKAAPSLVRLLLGVLDKGVLRLGDGSSVNFERSLIFFTSNLGARNMQQLLRPRFTLVRQEASSAPSPAKLKDVAEQAARRHFSPEFMNRIDGIFTFQPLSRRTLARILDNMIAEIQSLLDVRMPSRELRLDVRPSARRLLLEKGTSPEYGARELKRALFRLLLHPLAALLAHGTVEAGSAIIVQAARGGARLAFRLKPCRPAA